MVHRGHGANNYEEDDFYFVEILAKHDKFYWLDAREEDSKASKKLRAVLTEAVFNARGHIEF